MEYEVEGVITRGKPNKTWSDIVEKDFQARNYPRRILWTLWNTESQLKVLLLLLLHLFNDLFSRTTCVSPYQKVKTSLDLNEARDVVQ